MQLLQKISSGGSYSRNSLGKQLFQKTIQKAAAPEKASESCYSRNQIPFSSSKK
ncbi:hypothetical protein TSAR_003695 [Trichomalopsis sarcophagae]|uniref:Uncharacterized protein n=1 Tax=Trichomalopsis sarcophagae TaxID=543379 RepID=A0A232EY98_9HYME|nr:hypothetical protein TSAR_003695 [Trichomalopsis sarcophagae]